jgi:hypothetical protein
MSFALLQLIIFGFRERLAKAAERQTFSYPCIPIARHGSLPCVERRNRSAYDDDREVLR